jgi:16S rRNA (uracil1498-N3)-methyltransferase
MRLNRFYTERTNVRLGSSVKLPDFDINHIRKVLRLKKGDKIIIFNGEKEYLAELRIVGSEVITAILTEELRSEDFSSEAKVEITLFQGLLRAGKFDDILEKTTELGIDYVVPVECEFSQSKVENANAKIERWNKVIIAASKQSERVRVPDLIQPMYFTDALEHLKEFDKVYFFSTAKNLEILNVDMQVDKLHRKVAYLIGPEGGFSPTENKLAQEHNLQFYTMGKTILRSETAAIFGAGLLNYLYNS